MNEFGKYRLFRKYASLDGVNYTPLDEYQALLVENNSCQCGYRELEYRFDGEYNNDTFYKYEIWNEYSFCPTDSSYDELTGNVDYRNPIYNEGVMLATYKGNGRSSVKLCNYTSFFQNMAINNVELGRKTSAYTFNNTDINEVAYSNVTSILNKTFSGCTRLKSVVIGNSVTSIGDFAFRYCSGLTSVTIPSSVTSIGDYAFEGCKSLKSVTIPSSVTSINNATFYDCHSLTSITIPSSVTTIGYYAFEGCNSLTSINIPSSVTSIFNEAFYGCDSLKSITCYATTSPSLGNDVFKYLPTNGTLHVPNGSDYQSWLSKLPSGWTIEYI